MKFLSLVGCWIYDVFIYLFVYLFIFIEYQMKANSEKYKIKANSGDPNRTLL